MAETTIFQHWIFSEFIFPFLLIWVLLYAVLGKTKLLGENKQVDALISFVIGFIFVSALRPKEITGNLILFLTVAIVVIFVTLILWGFVSGSDLSKEIIGPKALKWVVGIAIVVATGIALLWAAGIQNEVINLLFNSSWSSDFWVNVAFIAVISIALALVLKSGSK